MSEQRDIQYHAHDPLVTVEAVDLAYDSLTVLEDVSFAIDRGSFVGLIGPNGAGKTSLVHALAGGRAPAVSGRITVDGQAMQALSARASSRLVSVVPQDTALSFSFPVRRIVEMGRHPHRSRFSPPSSDDQALVDRALERTRTAQFADRSIDEISGGERQRVLFARALAQDTPLMLLDEPTASLDINHQIETLELARDLTADGRTIVAAIHDLELAARYCDRLIILANGTVQADGEPESVLTAPALEDAFDAETVVGRNPVTGRPTVTAVSTGEREAQASRLSDRSVHVIGGGAGGATVLERVATTGAKTSVGPVSSDSIVTQRAQTLPSECLTTEPFAPVSDALRRAVLERCQNADVVIVADAVVTAGNQLLFEELDPEMEMVIVETTPFSRRNFAGTGATETYRSIRERAVEATPAGVVDAVERCCIGASGKSTRESSDRSPPETTTDD